MDTTETNTLATLTNCARDMKVIYQDLSPTSRSLSLAKTQAELAGMLINKVKGLITDTTPYPDSTDGTKPGIAPTADPKAELVIKGNEMTFPSGVVQLFDPELGETGHIKALRGRCEEIGDILDALFSSGIIFKDKWLTAQAIYNHVLVAVQNTKMYLGLVLGEIRDNEQDNKVLDAIFGPVNRDTSLEASLIDDAANLLDELTRGMDQSSPICEKVRLWFGRYRA